MKKTVKIIMVCSLLVFVAGLIATTVGMSALGWDFYKLDTHTYTEKYIDTSHKIFEDAADEDGNAAITKIVADIEEWSVKVTTGERFEFKYYVTEDVKVEEITFVDGVVKINIKEDWRKYFNFDIFGDSKRWKLKYELTVPQGIDIDFDFTNSDINIEDATFGEFKIKSSNCKQVYKNIDFTRFISDCTNSTIEMTDCTADSVDISGSNGNATLKSSEFGKISYHNTNGKIVMNNSSVEGETQIKGTNLDSKFTDSAFNVFTFNSTNGDVDFNRVSMTSMSVKGTNIDVDSKGYIDCDVFVIDGTNASVKLTILGAEKDMKYVKFHGTHSSVWMCGDRIKSHHIGDGEKTVDAKGTNLSLKITFVTKDN